VIGAVLSSEYFSKMLVLSGVFNTFIPGNFDLPPYGTKALPSTHRAAMIEFSETLNEYWQ
jgi:hypothetical protein